MRKIKVVVLLLGVERYGVQRFLADQYEYSKKYMIDFNYLCISEGDMSQKLRSMGAKVDVLSERIGTTHFIKIQSFAESFIKKPWDIFRVCLKINRYLKKNCPEILYTHNGILQFLGGIVAKLNRIKCIRHFHAISNKTSRSRLFKVLWECVLSIFVDIGLAVSNAVTQSLSGILRKKTKTLYSGLNFDNIRERIQILRIDKENKDVDIIYVGRIAPMKKQSLAIDALKLLIDDGIQAKLAFVGGPIGNSNQYYLNLMEKCKNLGIEDKVQFKGFEISPEIAIAKAKISILCCSVEAFGMVVLESMACGTPVVVVDSCGPKEIVKHRQTGLKFEPDNVNEFKKCLEELLCNEELRNTLSKNAYTEAKKNFSMTSHMEQIQKIFCELVNYDYKKEK